MPEGFTDEREVLARRRGGEELDPEPCRPVVGGSSFAVRLSEAATDAGGIATLDAPLGQHGLALRLPGPGHRPKVVHGVRAESGEPFDVVVDADTRLTGRVTPPDLVARLAQQAHPGQGLRAGLRLRKADNPAEWLPGPGPLHGIPVGVELHVSLFALLDRDTHERWVELVRCVRAEADTRVPEQPDVPGARLDATDAEAAVVELRLPAGVK